MKLRTAKHWVQKPTFKVWSVTAEIFLIWTNVVRTNVDLTNITETVEICSRWSEEPTFKVWSNFGWTNVARKDVVWTNGGWGKVGINANSVQLRWSWD